MKYVMMLKKEKLMSQLNEQDDTNRAKVPICIPENVNTTFHTSFFYYKITFVNSQYENANSNNDFV